MKIPKNGKKWIHPRWKIRKFQYLVNDHIYHDESVGEGRKMWHTWNNWIIHEIAHAVVAEGEECLKPDFGIPYFFPKNYRAFPNWAVKKEIEVLCVQELLQQQLKWPSYYEIWDMTDLSTLMSGTNNISNMKASTHIRLITDHRNKLTLEDCWRRLQETHKIWDQHGTD